MVFPSPESVVVQYGFTTFFALCSYVNYNDPDPWLWCTLYGAASLYFAFALSLKRPQRLISTGLLMAMVATAFLSAIQNIPFDKLEGTWDFFEYEEGREVAGLGCLVLALTYAYGAGGSQSLAKHFLGFTALALIVAGILSLFWVQPLMNLKRPVEHCQGAL